MNFNLLRNKYIAHAPQSHVCPTCVKIIFCEVYIDPGNPGNPQCLQHTQLWNNESTAGADASVEALKLYHMKLT